MAEPATSAATASTGASSPVRHFLDVYEREHATTMRVLRAYPPEQGALRPHERSSTALQLAFTFLVEQALLLRAVRGEPLLGGGLPSAPERWEDAVAAYERRHAEVVRAIEERADALPGGTVQFFTGPKQMGDYRGMDFLWFMLHDQIHHRGQLSVYLRMAGGKVPSIYGPSADEPWN